MKSEFRFKIILLLIVLSGGILTSSCIEERNHKITFSSTIYIDTLPFVSEPTSNLISLEAIVQREPYKLTFDTGAPTTLINSNIPSKKILEDTVHFHNILFQPLPSFQVMVDTLQLGRMKVINMDSYLQRELNFDGILGQDIIDKFVWKIDLIHRKAYVAEDISRFPVKGNGLPFTRKGEHIFITCEFEGVSLDLIVDTGYGGFISIDKKSVDWESIMDKEPIFWEGVSTRQVGNPFASSAYSSHVDSTYYYTGNLKFGNFELQDEIIELRNFPLNIIGMDFFRRFDHFILDYPNQRIYFGEEQKKSLNFLIYSLMRLNSKGVTFIPSRSKAQIGRITMWAKNEGINYLDTVLSIDGISVIDRDSSFYQDKSKFNTETNVYEYNPSKFMRLWNDFHFVSDTSVIELKRGDSSQTLTLSRRFLFREMPDSILDYYVELSLPLPNIDRIKTESDTYYFKFNTDELLPPGLRRK